MLGLCQALRGEGEPWTTCPSKSNESGHLKYLPHQPHFPLPQVPEPIFSLALVPTSHMPVSASLSLLSLCLEGTSPQSLGACLPVL